MVVPPLWVDLEGMCGVVTVRYENKVVMRDTIEERRGEERRGEERKIGEVEAK
jgi:hypothetical protein